VTGFAIIDAWLSDSVWRHEMIVSALRHMVLPVLTLAVAPTTEVIRLMRLSTIEVFDQNCQSRRHARTVAPDHPAPQRPAQRAAAVIPRLGLQFSPC
jgi:cationic peptide transport system permease protein